MILHGLFSSLTGSLNKTMTNGLCDPLRIVKFFVYGFITSVKSIKLLAVGT